MQITFTSLLVLTLFCKPLLASQIALTFDDAPRGDEKIYSGVQRTQKIIDVLAKHGIQSMFFVNSDKLSLAKGTDRISAYSKAGHLIANHTHSHARLKDTPTKVFLADIDQADQLLKTYPTFSKWFRFPYLGEGATVEVRDQVRAHLQSAGYRNGYVTVDNYDYFINDLVQKALHANKRVNLERACEMLVDVMWDGIKFYDDIAIKHLGKVRHVLLMHENDIEAHCLEKLIGRIREKGWEIISPEVAFNDPLLSTEPNTLYLNQGRVAAVVHAKTGVKYISKWESESVLTNEFEQRQIVSKRGANE